MLELLVVSVLLAIMLGLTVPRVQGLLFNDPLKRSARLVVSVLNEARGKALGSEQGTVVLIDISSGGLEIRYQQQAAGRNSVGPEAPVKAQLESSVNLGSVWTLTGGQERSGTVLLWINRRGLVEPSIIELKNQDRIISVKAAPFAAEAEVFDYALVPPAPLFTGASPNS